MLSLERSLRVGIIGDFCNSPSHVATNEALDHAASALSVALDRSWLPTQQLDKASGEMLRQFDAFWAASGGPYKSMTGALEAIQFAREGGWPFIGT